MAQKTGRKMVSSSVSLLFQYQMEMMQLLFVLISIFKCITIKPDLYGLCMYDLARPGLFITIIDISFHLRISLCHTNHLNFESL